MTVADLIKRLQAMPQDGIVWVTNATGNSWVPIRVVEVRTKTMIPHREHPGADIVHSNVYLDGGS